MSNANQHPVNLCTYTELVSTRWLVMAVKCFNKFVRLFLSYSNGFHRRLLSRPHHHLSDGGYHQGGQGQGGYNSHHTMYSSLTPFFSG